MAVTYDQAVRLALRLPGVVEGRAYGGPSLHVGRKFLGRLREDGETLVLKVDPADRARLLEQSPDAFFLIDHYRDSPLVLINLLAVERAVLADLIERAWRLVAPKCSVLAYDAHRPGSGG